MTSPLTVALCHENVLPRRGGCESYVAGLAARLCADGHRVHLLARRWDADALPPSLVFHPVRLPGLHPRLLRPWLFSRACRRVLDDLPHDVSIGFDKIHGVDVYFPQGGVHSLGVERSLGKHPSALVRTAAKLVHRLDPTQWSFAALERAQFRRKNSVVVALSGLVAEQLRASGVNAPARIAHVPIAARPDRLPDDAPRREVFRRAHAISDGSPLALFVGMNYRLKGLVPLLHALAASRTPGLTLAVAGKPSVAEYRRLASRLGVADRVRFLGFVADMRDAYAGADFLAHPTFYDPCATVVPEALAWGLPVVTSAHNGAADLIGPGAGVVVGDPHDIPSLAAALDALADPAGHERRRDAALRSAAAWTYDDHFAALVGVLRRFASLLRLGGHTHVVERNLGAEGDAVVLAGDLRRGE